MVKVSDRMFTFVHTLFSQKSTNFAADAARTTCTVKNNFFGVPKNKTICAKKKHLDFYNIKIVQVEALCTYCALVTASVLPSKTTGLFGFL